MTPKQQTTVAPEEFSADADRLRVDADRLAREAAEAYGRVQQAAAADAARAAQRQADADRQTLDNYSRAKLDEAVDQARRDLDTAVRELPVTQALANYLAAQVARYESVLDLLAARQRLGLPTAGASMPMHATVGGLEEYVNDAATRLAAEITDAARLNRQETGQ